LEDSYFPEDPALVVHAINNGMAIMIRDGSYKPLLFTEQGAAAWIIECSMTGAICYGECDTSGTQHEVNAYHSEVQGCHAGFLSLLAFSIFHELQGVEVAFVSTMTQVLTRLQQDTLTSQPGTNILIWSVQ
jgi:hypothetical protein